MHIYYYHMNCGSSALDFSKLRVRSLSKHVFWKGDEETRRCQHGDLELADLTPSVCCSPPPQKLPALCERHDLELHLMA